MLDETVETRPPWRGSPRTCVHAGAFLRFMGIISTVSKSLRYALLLKRVCPHQSPAYVPYVVANCEIHVHPRTPALATFCD